MRTRTARVWRQVRLPELPGRKPRLPKPNERAFSPLLSRLAGGGADGAAKPAALSRTQLAAAPGSSQPSAAAGPAQTPAGLSQSQPRTTPASAQASPPAANTHAPAPGSGTQAQDTAATPPPGLIKVALAEPGSDTSGLWWDPDTNTYWTGDYTTGEWRSLGPAQERPNTVQVAPHIGMPLGLYAQKLVGLGVRRVMPGVGAWVGGQFIRAKDAAQAKRIWQNQASLEELAFIQTLPSVLPHPQLQRQAAAYTNPREYFRDDEVYADLLLERGVPRSPEEALAFWQEYQQRVYEKHVRYAQIVGLDPSIYPPPDRWPDVLDQVGKPPQDPGGSP